MDACRYNHDGPKGGGTTSTTMAVTNKRIKKEKNKKPSLVITEKIKENEKGAKQMEKESRGAKVQTRRIICTN